MGEIKISCARVGMIGTNCYLVYDEDIKETVIIDPGDNVLSIISKILESKKWRLPSLERFIYDFLEQIIHEDLALLEKYEKELDSIDKDINKANIKPTINFNIKFFFI